MKLWRYTPRVRGAFILGAALLVSCLACEARNRPASLLGGRQTGAAGKLTAVAVDNPASQNVSVQENLATPLPRRPNYQPGELVDYTAQTGDILPALATRFNTSVAEILAANSIIPEYATTMPPGMPMKIPIYYLPFWGTPYKIMPDSLFVNGPAEIGFDAESFVAEYPGWLKDYQGFAGGSNRSGAGIVDLVALRYSISPRLLLALLEYQAGALTQAAPPGNGDYPLDYRNKRYQGVYLQLIWAANVLNDGYYRWRSGGLPSFEFSNGRIERPDPWENAATVSLHYYFSRLQPEDVYSQSISPEGFAATYHSLFGDPWAADQPHIPGSLEQPKLTLPFEPGKIWAYTGGPHTAWGNGQPWAALDFAPPSVASGCVWSDEWVTAMAAGLVTREDMGMVILDLDGDGDERTGWVIFYMHVATKEKVALGVRLETGDFIGHPSCEGGNVTGTHVHIARKYNGEWILADGPLAFNLDGWIAHSSNFAYQGTLTRVSQVVLASTTSNFKTHIAREGQ